ncbi:hypothetical protein N2152v2_000078 [Parachlorella kessleri]
MKVEEVFKALCPGARVLDTAENASHLAERRVLADLAADYLSKLSTATPEEAVFYARRCATLFAKLLSRLREDDRCGYGVEALPSFVVLGMKRLSEEGKDAAACRSCVLRVLAGLVRAADREPALCAEVSSPALWCGVDLLVSIDGRQAAWKADHDSQAATIALALATPGVDASITTAFQAATVALAASNSASPEVELMFLLSAGRLHQLTEWLSARERSLGAPSGELLNLLDKWHFMVCNVQLVQRLIRFLFIKKAPEAGDGEASLLTVVAADAAAATAHQGDGSTSMGSQPPFPGPLTKVTAVWLVGIPQLLEALGGLLTSLDIFLKNGMQLEAFVQGQGINVMLAVLLVGISFGGKFRDVLAGSGGCVCLAADCLIAAVESDKEAMDALTSDGGCRQLLEIIQNLPLRHLAEPYVDNAYDGSWHLLCACLAVLDLAVCKSEPGREEFLRAGGIKTLLQATRWDPRRPGSCDAPPEVRTRAEANVRSGGLPELFRAVATHARSVVGQVWMRGEAVLDAKRQLASLSTLGELEQFARIMHSSSGAPEQPGGKEHGKHLRQPRREAGFGDPGPGVESSLRAPEQQAARSDFVDESGAGRLRDKYASSLSLSHAVVFCAQVLLSLEKGRSEISLITYPQLYSQMLSLAEASTSDAIVLAQSVAFTNLAEALRGGAACQMQLLQDRVHVKAATALTAALTHVKELAQAARSSRRVHAYGSSPQAAVLNDMAKYGALILNTSLLLLGLKQAGAGGQRAALKVVDDGQLEEAAAGAALALSGPHPNCKAAEHFLTRFLSWAHDLLQRNGGRGPSAQRAEAAAAALLAEEEAEHSKAAAKAAKRQRQKAGKQRAKQEAGQGSQQHAEAPAVTLQGSKPWAMGAAGEPSSPMLPATAAPTEHSGCVKRAKEDFCAGLQDVAAEQQEAEDGAVRQAGARMSGGRSLTLKKPLKKKKQQQREALNEAAGAASTGLQQTGGGSFPALPATSGGSKQLSTANTRTAAIATSPAMPAVPAPATPARQQTRRAGAVALPSSPAAAPPPQEQLGAAARPPQHLPVPPGGGAPSASGADEQEAEHKALLELLLPGITLGKHSQQVEPPVGYPVPPAAAVTEARATAAGLGSGSSSTVGAARQESAVASPTLPAVLVCALTGQRLTDPVIAADGYTYERQALAAWLQRGSSRSPVTGRAMASGMVRPNFAVRELLLALED